MPSFKQFSTKYLTAKHINIRKLAEIYQKNLEKKLDKPASHNDADNLSEKERPDFILQKKDQNTPLMKTALDLNLTLQFLSTGQRNQLIFKNYKNKLAALTQNSYDLTLILQYLSASTRRYVLFEEYKYHLDSLIKRPADLNLILQSLSEEERKLLFWKKKDQITLLIKTTLDFNLVLEFCPEAHKKILFQQKRDQIKHLIKTALDLNLAFQFLSTGQRELLFWQKKDDLIHLIKTPHDLNLMLQCLPTEEYTTLYEAIKSRAETFRSAFLDHNYCFINIDSTQHLRMYHLLFKESLAKIRDCLDQIRKNLNLDTPHTDHFEDKNQATRGNNLDAILENLQNIVNQALWRKKGIAFFGRKVPDGIKKLIHVFKDKKTTQIEKLKEIECILADKCANVSIFRAHDTHTLYKNLHLALQPCTPCESKPNKIP